MDRQTVSCSGESWCSTQICEFFCDTNQFPTLPFCYSYLKPRGARGLSKHYHLCFDPNLSHGICEISRIPCACVGFTSMLAKPWISGTQSTKQSHYQSFTNCTYWIVLGPYKNWNIIELTPKLIPSEEFDETHEVVIYGISKKGLVTSIKYVWCH